MLKKFKFVDIKIGSKDASFVNPAMRESKYGMIRYDGPPTMDASVFKQEFLAGDKAAIFYCDPNNPQGSTYATRFKGIPCEDKAQILDDGRTTFAAAATIPDPQTMHATRKKWGELDNDRFKLTRRMFARSGMTTLSPKGGRFTGFTNEQDVDFS